MDMNRFFGFVRPGNFSVTENTKDRFVLEYNLRTPLHRCTIITFFIMLCFCIIAFTIQASIIPELFWMIISIALIPISLLALGVVLGALNYKYNCRTIEIDRASQTFKKRSKTWKWWQTRKVFDLSSIKSIEKREFEISVLTYNNLTKIYGSSTTTVTCISAFVSGKKKPVTILTVAYVYKTRMGQVAGILWDQVKAKRGDGKGEE